MNIYDTIRIGILVLNVILVIWVVNDAKKRDAHPVAWGIVVLLFGIIGWLIYFITRGSGTSAKSAGDMLGDSSQSQVSQESMGKSGRQQVQIGGVRYIEKPGVKQDDIFE
jgi:hypothetical protein